jgi:hypothetical protein
MDDFAIVMNDIAIEMYDIAIVNNRGDIALDDFMIGIRFTGVLNRGLLINVH